MIHIDLETRSRVDLKTLGVYKYTECPDFRILMASWSADDGATVQTAIGHDEVMAIPGLFEDEKVAHNAMFERVCLSVLDERLREPGQWVDTQALALEYGYPAGLDNVARWVKAERKDQAGKDLIKLFCVPRKDGGWNDHTTHPLEWLDFIAYCEQDVVTLADVHRRLGDFPNALERSIWCADQLINDRGMRIDLDLCTKASQVAAENKGVNKAAFTELTGVVNPGSVQQVGRWLRETGLPLPNLRAETIEAVLLRPGLSDLHRQALELRQDLAGAAEGKFAAALQSVSPDGRIRGGFRFFGAHTGRWSGQRVQPQNLPRAAFKLDVDRDIAIEDLMDGQGADPYTLKALVRAMFVGPFVVADYASIEARVIAWLAGEQWAIQAFLDGRDIYVETAQRMGGLTRAQGKIAVLALGYNGGVNSLRAMGAEGNDAELMTLVTTWRRANRRIVDFWGKIADKIEFGGPVGAYCRIERRGSTMKIHLPSGRAIVYHGVSWDKYTVVDPRTGKTINKEGWRYSNPQGGRIGTYGGRLAENITQAVARDLLGEALIDFEAQGYAVVAHIHDEVLVETDDLDGVLAIMRRTPKWAPGLPVDAEGFTTYRYRKG